MTKSFMERKERKVARKKNKDSFKSSKKGKSSKSDASSSTGKANFAGTSPNDEHVEVQDSSATGQDNWSDDGFFWGSTYGCWCYYEQWDASQDQWTYFTELDRDGPSEHEGLEGSTNFTCDMVICARRLRMVCLSFCSGECCGIFQLGVLIL